jgi:hypothetical protein
MSQQKKNIFIDASLHSAKWFDDLPLEYQMTNILLWMLSDNIGVWKPHPRELHFKLKQDINLNDFQTKVNQEREVIRVLENGDWWLLDYLPLQVKTLTPNNRVHVSYIEALREKGLLSIYAEERPENVNFEVIFELENYKSIKNEKEKRKAESAFQYLQSKGLVRPLKDSFKTLARVSQDSKEEEEEENKESDREEGKDNRSEVGLGKGSPYYRSKSIADRLFTPPGESSDNLVSEINELAKEIETGLSIDEPFELIEAALQSLEEYYTIEDLTFEQLKKEIKDSYALT